MLGVTKTDRIMWFSMWFLASIASFGIAFFPMFYLMIKRRNKHFQRHIEKEKKINRKISVKFESTILGLFPKRNARLWTFSLIFIFPVFIITYLLTKDLITHEKYQKKAYSNIFPERKITANKVSIRKYSIITILTGGIGIIYWLYKIINMYNMHFIEQEKIEREIDNFLREQ